MTPRPATAAGRWSPAPGVAGGSAARAPAGRVGGAGCCVTRDRRAIGARPSALRGRGADVRLGAGGRTRRRRGPSLVVTSPGLAAGRTRCCGAPRGRRRGDRRGRAGLAAAAAAPAPWLALTGTNGKTTTVRMLDAMLRGGGPARRRRRQRRAARGRRRHAPTRRTTCWPSSCPASSCTGPVAAPAAAARAQPRAGPSRLARRLRRRTRPPRRGSGPARDRRGRQRRRPARSRPAGRPRAGPAGLASRSARPAPGQLGVVGGVLVDRAFGATATSWPPRRRRAPGRPAQRRQRARRRGAGPRPTASRRRRSGRAARVRPGPAPQRAGRRASPASRYVDDSKATNPHAAAASLRLVRAGGVDRRRAAQGRRRSTSWSRSVRRPAAPARSCWAPTGRALADGARATRPQPPGRDGLAGPTMERCRGRARGRRPGPARRHGAARPGRRVDGHVPRLQGPRATRSPRRCARWRSAG